MFRTFKLLGTLLVCLSIPFTCTVGNGSGVGNGMVTGMLYEPDGVTPASNALVVIRHQNTTALISSPGNAKTTAALYTTLTGSDGTFSFDTIANGLYVIEGSDLNDNLVRYDSVAISSTAEPVDLPDGTLKPAGAVSGRIDLPRGGSYLKTFILAFGVDRFCQVREDGTFLFDGLAEGEYVFKVLSLDPEYGSVDLPNIRVTSDSTVSLDTITLPTTNRQPVPRNVTIEYDPLLMTATLSWNKTPDGSTRGYNLYRLVYQNPESTPEASRLNGDFLIKDSLFLDSAIMQAITTPHLTATGRYAVTMVDTFGNESSTSDTVSVHYGNKWEEVDSMPLTLPDYYRVDWWYLDENDNILMLGNYGTVRSEQWFYADGSRRGSFTITDSAVTTSQKVIVRTQDDGSVWLRVYVSPMLPPEFDSEYRLYHYSATGSLIGITPFTDISGGSNYNNGLTVGDDYYFSNSYTDEIDKISYRTGEASVIAEKTSDMLPVLGIFPASNDAVLYAARNGTAKEDRFTLVTADGSRGETVATINYRESDGGLLNGHHSPVADSMYYYDSYCYRQNTDNTFTRMAMPANGSKCINSKGYVTILINSQYENRNRVYTYKLK